MSDDKRLGRCEVWRRRNGRLQGTGFILDGDEVFVISDRILSLINSQPRTPTRQQVADDISRSLEHILATEIERNCHYYDQQYRSAFLAEIGACFGGKGEITRGKLKARLGEDIYSSWFASMRFESFEDRVVRVSVPVKFIKNWISAHYADLLLECCAAEFPGAERVEVILRSGS